MTNLYPFILIILLSFSSQSISQQTTSLGSMDQLIRDYVAMFESNDTKNTYRTGEIHNINLPSSNFSGITAQAARFRCGSLRRYGARMDEFELGVGVTVYPCVERVIVVTYNLGINRSTSIYNHANYQLASPILGLTAYNFDEKGSNPFEIRIRSSQGNPITINFSNISTSTTSTHSKCASFEEGGKLMSLKEPISPQVCSSTSNGHYGLVVRIPAPPASPAVGRGKAAVWKVAVGSSVGGVLGISLLGLLVVAMVVKVKKKAKMLEMERKAYEEEALQVSMVGHFRTPLASATRTQPTIDHPPVNTL
ncbi:hypothetical protein LINGRAHAP2_LOCUS3354 [Linum grandiflorum]